MAGLDTMKTKMWAGGMMHLRFPAFIFPDKKPANIQRDSGKQRLWRWKGRKKSDEFVFQRDLLLRVGGGDGRVAEICEASVKSGKVKVWQLIQRRERMTLTTVSTHLTEQKMMIVGILA
jgi:hypothetical protein